MGVLIARFLITALAFLMAAELVPGIEVASFYTALILAFFWGIIGLTIRPILLLLTLPINFLTFGLFTFIINGFLFWFLSTFVEGFTVDGFSSALLGAVIISIAVWLGGKLIKTIA
ncbi:MAG: phage holin family protein [Parcubacteria group bacterium]|nr:phage holin family protein [Parcubacteria group bacterium]MBI3074680.1 phage holin family protein [Parcubacteria group bacterium]